jgi:Phosphotransferase System HPr (HPr) Family
MKSFEYVLNVEEGLHARPAKLLVTEAAKLKSVIVIDKEGLKGNAKKIFAVMGLCVKKGDRITVSVEGESEESDYPIMEALFRNNF